MSRTIFIVALVSVVFTRTQAGRYDSNQTERLRKKLLEKYDKGAPPRPYGNDTTTVYFGIIVNSMWIEDDKQIFNLNSMVIMLWTDQRLVWDSKDYGDLTVLRLGDHEIWQPDLTVYNNADISEVDHYGNVHCLTYPNGEVLWIPPAVFRVECPLDFTYWPYDTQSCNVSIGSWTAHGWMIDVQKYHNQKKVIKGSISKESHMWQFVSGYLERDVTKYECCPEPYITMVLVIKMQRSSPMYTMTVVIPAIAISLLTLFQFLLPLRDSRRLTIGCSCSILTMLMLLYLASVIPHVSTSLPIIVKFFGQTLLVVVLSLGVNTCILRLGSNQSPGVDNPPPEIIKIILTGPLSSVLMLQAYTQKVGRSGGGSEDGEVLENTTHIVTYDHEWLLVAAAVDRVSAITFCAIFIITLLAYVTPV